MTILAAGTAGLPYQPLRIIDVSPYRSSIDSRPASAPGRPDPSPARRLAMLTGLALAVVLMVAAAGVASGGWPV